MLFFVLEKLKGLISMLEEYSYLLMEGWDKYSSYVKYHNLVAASLMVKKEQFKLREFNNISDSYCVPRLSSVIVISGSDILTLVCYCQWLEHIQLWELDPLDLYMLAPININQYVCGAH